MLYLVATPIGNLADITFRAIETLKLCDYILCEDTRHSRILLRHYQIQKPLKSYHKFNEAEKAKGVLQDLESGKIICLITDAGTPGISDPGENLVRCCIERGLAVTAVPGPCAAIQALSCSGLSTERFQFLGFLPRKEGELKKILQNILTYAGTTICYESPQRLLKTLTLLHQLQPERQVVVARELTKKFEEYARGTAQELLHHWQNRKVQGEVVLLIGGQDGQIGQEWTKWTPQEHVEWVQKQYGLDKKEAIKLVAELRGMPKRQIYQEIINQQ